jgi:hypothetical protein
MSASGNPSYRTDSAAHRGLPVVSAPGPEAEPAVEPHPADVAHLERVRSAAAETGWSPTEWRRKRGGAE